MTTAELQIREVIATWLRASAEDDLATLMTLMTEDIVFLLPGREIRGREAFAEMSRAMKGKFRIEGKPDIQEIHVSGDHAYCWNFLSLTVTPVEAGDAMKRAGHILSVFRKEADGRWRLHRDANLLVNAA